MLFREFLNTFNENSNVKIIWQEAWREIDGVGIENRDL